MYKHQIDQTQTNRCMLDNKRPTKESVIQNRLSRYYTNLLLQPIDLRRLHGVRISTSTKELTFTEADLWSIDDSGAISVSSLFVVLSDWFVCLITVDCRWCDLISVDRLIGLIAVECLNGWISVDWLCGSITLDRLFNGILLSSFGLRGWFVGSTSNDSTVLIRGVAISSSSSSSLKSYSTKVNDGFAALDMTNGSHVNELRMNMIWNTYNILNLKKSPRNPTQKRMICHALDSFNLATLFTFHGLLIAGITQSMTRKLIV